MPDERHFVPMLRLGLPLNAQRVKWVLDRKAGDRSRHADGGAPEDKFRLPVLV